MKDEEDKTRQAITRKYGGKLWRRGMVHQNEEKGDSTR
jgi:hypothetical protein